MRTLSLRMKTGGTRSINNTAEALANSAPLIEVEDDPYQQIIVTCAQVLVDKGMGAWFYFTGYPGSSVWRSPDNEFGLLVWPDGRIV